MVPFAIPESLRPVAPAPPVPTVIDNAVISCNVTAEDLMTPPAPPPPACLDPPPPPPATTKISIADTSAGLVQVKFTCVERAPVFLKAT